MPGKVYASALVAVLTLVAVVGCSEPTAACTFATAAWVDTVAVYPDGSPAMLTYGCANEPRRVR